MRRESMDATINHVTREREKREGEDRLMQQLTILETERERERSRQQH